ncbi:TBC1 domain family member 2B [Salvelinus fontinalis]|uniref:TBC1 domain family member 2B n=1 Tax=Salvelinus fontinalis TaxID=8038 RepID=UPI002486076B|nr:TBC1 domain family member 2B [Salvelinus fontinalis]
MHEEDGGEEISTRDLPILASNSVDEGEPESPKDPVAKLCGYLTKLAGKGPLRGFKLRWFVYDERKCYLYYFKTPQDALPLGHIAIGEASFSYDVEGDEGQFEIRTAGKEFLLKAPNRQVMQYWLQQLQQKRWEFSNTRGSGQRDSWISPTPHTGLVAKDTDVFVFEKPSHSDSMDRVRSDFAMETDTDGLVGVQSARGPSHHPANPLNFSSKLGHWSTEIRNSMSGLRVGRGGGGGENRRSVFYTGNSADEWEMLDAPTTKDINQDHKPPIQPQTDTHRHSIGSPFTFDFGRSSSSSLRPKRPTLRDIMGSGRLGRNAESSSPSSQTTSPVECNGSRTNELQLRLQGQEQELTRLHEENNNLTEELTSQKELVRLLQQTLRSTQREIRPAPPAPVLTPVPASPPALGPGAAQASGPTSGPAPAPGFPQSASGPTSGSAPAPGPTSGSAPASGPTSGSAPAPGFPQSDIAQMEALLLEREGQVQALCCKMERLALEKESLQRELKGLKAKVGERQAKLCQVESKYLVLLQDLKNPVCSSSDHNPAREVISRLLEDALDNTDPTGHAIFKPHPVSEYDVFGFKTVPEEDDEEEKLVAKVRALDLRSLSLTDPEVSVGVKWENYLSSTMNRDMVHCPELKALMRSGVPHVHRSKVWRWCVSYHTRKFRDSLAPNYYETLLGVARDKPNPASKQIELDLLRTLPNNKHYSSPGADGIQKLRNVLLAFSWRNPDIGYCQGLNRLAAIALLYLDQEDAFWCLITIVEVFMPQDYYTKTLLGSQVDQRVFKDLLSEKLPRLHAHFDLYKVDSSLITFNWFLVLFVDSVNSDLLFKIWDAFLYEGPKIIFRFALALFKYKEEEFLKLQDSMAIFKYLRYFTITVLDWRKLMSLAFVDMNPFPLRQIQNRRTFHLEKVRLELTELEAIRQTFLRERDTHTDARALCSDDEEDN